MGLKEAKDKVEAVDGGMPLIIGENVPKDKAKEIENKFKELGCELEISWFLILTKANLWTKKKKIKKFLVRILIL